MKKYQQFLISLALPFMAGTIGSLATSSAISTWYATLTKPTFNPPNWIFGPTWTVLYLLMGISLYRVWSQTSTSLNMNKQHQAITLFIIHLFINAFWSIAFFGMENPLLGFGTILVLLCLIAMIIWRFFQIDKIAAYLLIPYFIWVSFATLLNFSIWQLN